jgi:UDP-N-acetylglucosamine 2-epimerase
MKIVTIVGARPQFIKAAAVSRALRARHDEILIHTGQHYDDGMSSVFFDELDIPAPEYHLGVGSGPHGAQTGQMLAEIERVLLSERPDWALVYGDTNSTLAGALAATKLHVPVAHVEAGLRSFNRRMPEEVNRVLTDHVASLLFCPSASAVAQLAAEGIHTGVHLVGDVMAEAFLAARARALRDSSVHERLNLRPDGYWVATVHRAENTDEPSRLQSILVALETLGTESVPVIFPVHPRTRRALDTLGVRSNAHVRLIDPLGYIDMAGLQAAARGILSDSGGVQKEAYWAGVPCTTLREETEWVETLESGWNALAGADTQRILAAALRPRPANEHPVLYGGDGAAARIITILEQHLPAQERLAERSDFARPSSLTDSPSAGSRFPGTTRRSE